MEKRRGSREKKSKRGEWRKRKPKKNKSGIKSNDESRKRRKEA